MSQKYFGDPFCYKRRIATNDSAINAAEISPSGALLATAGDDGNVFLVSVSVGMDGKKEFICTPHNDPIAGIDYPSEDLLYTAGCDGQICWFDINRLACRRAYKAAGCCTKVSTSQDYNLLAASTPLGVLFYDENASYKPISKISAFHPVLSFRPNKPEFVIGTLDHTLQLFDIRSLDKPLETFSTLGCDRTSKNYIRYVSFDSLNPLRNYRLSKIPNKIDDCVFNKTGTLLLVTECANGPAIFRADKSVKKALFSAPSMKNIVTSKSFRFGGPNDSFVLAGLDTKEVRYWPLDQSGCSDHFVESATRKLEKSSHITYVCNRSASLTGFRSVVNVALMHPKIPLIFCAGIENAVYVFSPFELGSDDEIEPNQDAIVYTETWLEEVYGG